MHDHPQDFPESCAKPKGLLQTLGMSDDHLVNIIMHKDIVPRAFVCDYTGVADLLKQMMPSFKDHSTLDDSNDHKSLYNFIGRMAVIRSVTMDDKNLCRVAIFLWYLQMQLEMASLYGLSLHHGH